MALTMRAGRLVRELRELNLQTKHIEHHRVHLQTEGFEAEDQDWNRPPIKITLAGPWKNREMEKIMRAWGIPMSHDDLETFVHHRDGGWGVFELPAMPTVHAFVAKVHKHPEAVVYIDLLCRVMLHSQYTLSEAVSMIVDLVKTDPRRKDVPAVRARDWEYLGRYVIDVLQARMQRPGDHASVGDARRVTSGIKQISVELGVMRVEASELQLASVRATLALRRAS